MFAVVFEYSVAPENQAAFDTAVTAFRSLREQQPGFCGTIEVALGAGRIAVNLLWNSQEARQATLRALAREHDHASSLFSAQMIGSGEVVLNTISARA